MKKMMFVIFLIAILSMTFRPAVGADGKADWDKLVTAAKKEGKVVVYTTAPGEMRQALQGGFKEKFGIDVEVTSFRGGEMGAKLLSERKAGIYIVDVFVGGSTTPITQLIWLTVARCYSALCVSKFCLRERDRYYDGRSC